MRSRIKIGDFVRIIDPKIVDRVGYPLIWRDLRGEFHADHPKVAEAMRLLGIRGRRAQQQFVDGVCRAMVSEHGFGGRERRIHYEDSPIVKAGDIEKVLAIRRCVTGDYVDGAPSIETPNGCYDGHPPSLENRKVHVLLYTSGGWIEAANVERLEDGNGKA